MARFWSGRGIEDVGDGRDAGDEYVTARVCAGWTGVELYLMGGLGAENVLRVGLPVRRSTGVMSTWLWL